MFTKLIRPIRPDKTSMMPIQLPCQVKDGVGAVAVISIPMRRVASSNILRRMFLEHVFAGIGTAAFATACPNR